ncbi:cation:proton antiporter [Rhodopila globiformis]|uniref:Sodium:proton exchanger n=1 Tax=Rhodopila globiformis TaxID=1071 RepID=A0A2S6NN44_RHOGL|nr:sodium:proton antiporter [Rhodopila globiformis]PPQ38289.1 sodium:proton exchanger [Rhodopila globiformis]
MDTIVANTIDLLVAAILVALVARRLRLPYTVGLVIAGIGLALTQAGVNVVLTHEFILDVILPPLLFEAAINIRWPDLRRDALPVLTLAIPGTLIAAAVVSTGIVLVLHWPLRSALLFGVLIAATDPVAVIAMFKDNHTEGRLRLLVESESLFNDGVAAVLFTLATGGMQLMGATAPTWMEAGKTLLLTAGGGIAIGLICAGAALLLVGRTTDRMVESTLTTVAAYGSFLLADRLHASGVLSTVAAGLVVGTVAVLRDDERSRMTQRGREFVLALWEFIAFIANSLVFLMIGVTVAGLSFARPGLTACAIIVGLVLLGRALTVYPLCLLFYRSRWKVPAWSQHVLWWGGLRGALGLALALSLPPDMAFRNEILVSTFAVVVFSVIVQGLTMPFLLRRAA